VALHPDEFDVVGILEEHTDRCPTAEERIAHNFEEGWPLTDCMIHLVGFQFMRALWISVAIGERERPEAADLQHRESRHIDGVLAIECQHRLDVVEQDDTHEYRHNGPVLLLSRQEPHG
jgi:hypothetical protein